MRYGAIYQKGSPLPECRHLVKDLQQSVYEPHVLECKACGSRWTRDSIFDNLRPRASLLIFMAFTEQFKDNDLMLETILDEGKTLSDLVQVVHIETASDEDPTWRREA
jgi:hypothetical protein